jgi:hypothetical protein
MCCISCMYEGYLESKFQWAIKKKWEYILQTMCIAIWCTYRTLLLNIVSTIVAALVIALHQSLYPFIIEWWCLQCTACGNGFFDLVIVEPLASKEGFKMQEQMKITWR